MSIFTDISAGISISNNLLVMLARLLLLAIFIAIIWRILKHRKKYAYAGLSEYKPSLLDSFVRHFSNNQPKRRWRKHNKTEGMCRRIMEKIYGRKFPTVRPDWLKSPMTGKNLELDCYNEELQLALEYNGQQHYAYTPFYHRNGKRDFYSQVHRDDWKRGKCRERGVCLIEVPYWVTPIDLEAFIVKELRKKGRLN